MESLPDILDQIARQGGIGDTALTEQGREHHGSNMPIQGSVLGELITPFVKNSIRSA